MTVKERNRCMKTARECGYGNGVIDAIFKAETDAEVYRILATAREKKAKEYDVTYLNLYHWKQVRKAVAMGVLALAAVTLPTSKAKADIYPECGIVTVVEDDDVTIETFNGTLWGIKGDDYMEGDVVAMIMDDHGTETVYDDEVITAKYCGWMED